MTAVLPNNTPAHAEVKYKMTEKIRIQDAQPIEIKRKVRTADGFLDLWGVAAAVGTMDYPEHGFTAYVPAQTLRDAAASLVGQPVTVEHPEDGVTPDNARHVTVGTVLESVFDEETGESRVHIRLYDAEAIRAVESGEKAPLSPGYDVSWRDATDAEKAEHNAEKVQAGRVYNHLALVEAARGGERTRLNTDGKPVADKTKTKDAEGAPADPANETMDAAKMLSDMKAMFDGIKSMYDQMFPPKKAEGDQDPAQPGAGLNEESDADEDKGESAMDARLKRHLRAADAARAVGIDPATFGAKTLDLERAVGVALVGDSAKTAEAPALSLLMDAAIKTAERPTTIADLHNPAQRRAGQKAQDAEPSFRMSPEDAYAQNLDRAARGLTTKE